MSLQVELLTCLLAEKFVANLISRVAFIGWIPCKRLPALRPSGIEFRKISLRI